MIGQPLLCRREESSLMEVGLPFSPAEPRSIVVFFSSSFWSQISNLHDYTPSWCRQPFLHFNISIWVEATGSVGIKRNLNKLNHHELRVTLRTIWPQSQQEFEEELGANEQDAPLSTVAHNWTKQFWVKPFRVSPGNLLVDKRRSNGKSPAKCLTSHFSSIWQSVAS